MPSIVRPLARRRSIALVMVGLVLVASSGCASLAQERVGAGAPSASMQGDAARPGDATSWIRSELYFGVGDRDDPASRIDDARWQGFLDREVTPRFPDGLTVLDAYGQWLFRGRAAPERLDSKVLVILHPGTAEARAKVEAIRRSWKADTGHQSVLWVSHAADVSF
jgi:hypothetical protein